jgi:UDP-3-O-acyl N-acetylglucosamine deacetylase
MHSPGSFSFAHARARYPLVPLAAQPMSSRLPRRTVASPATVSGVTLFTAARTTLVIRPPQGAPAGIAFRRIDLPDKPVIPADHAHTTPEPRRTVLAAGSGGGARVETVEHVLSALAGLGITDAMVDLDGPEVPVGDGSAAPFVEAIMAVGIVPCAPPPPAAAHPVRVTQPLSLADQNAKIDILPAQGDALELEYHLDYGPGSPIRDQHASIVIPLGRPAPGYAADIAPARTFCLLAEAQAMRKMGLFAHLEPHDMLVIGDDGAPIDNFLRFPDEPARHKLLDLLGDLSLAARPIIARVIATRSGHALNHVAAKAIAALA